MLDNWYLKVRIQKHNFLEIGWICLNIDGASKWGYIVGCGVKVESGFVVSEKWLGSCDAYVAEVWCACEGLKLARTRGFNRVELHVYSWVVATTLSSLKMGATIGWSLLQQIRRLLNMNQEIQICHSYKEVNTCANTLANIVCGWGFTLMLYEHCPAQISMLFLIDLVGVCTPRLVRRYFFSFFVEFRPSCY